MTLRGGDTVQFRSIDRLLIMKKAQNIKKPQKRDEKDEKLAPWRQALTRYHYFCAVAWVEVTTLPVTPFTVSLWPIVKTI